MMVCRNICLRLQDKNALGHKTNPYSIGRVYCRRCEVYYNYNTLLHCPCCGLKLRVKSRNRFGDKKQHNRVPTKPCFSILTNIR